VHRAIKHLLKGGTATDFDYPCAPAGHRGALLEHGTAADEATRDAVDWLKCEYMLDKVGQEFRGIITGVNSFGLFVELDEVYVTGLVHVTALDHDYFHFDPIGHRLNGERTGRVYRLGDPIWIQVAPSTSTTARSTSCSAPRGRGVGGSQAAAQSRREARRRCRGSREPRDEAAPRAPGRRRKRR